MEEVSPVETPENAIKDGDKIVILKVPNHFDIEQLDNQLLALPSSEQHCCEIPSLEGVTCRIQPFEDLLLVPQQERGTTNLRLGICLSIS